MKGYQWSVGTNIATCQQRAQNPPTMNLHVFFHDDRRTIKLLKRIAMNMQELKAAIDAATAQADKARAEIVQKITDLEAAIANAGNTTPEVDAALAALHASVQATDDVVPDAP